MKLSLVIFLISLVMTAYTQPTNHHFSHTVTTTASAEILWHIWTDVPNWKTWDIGLKEALLNDTFKEKARGYLIPDKGPKSRFIIEQVNENISYRLKTRIPFGWLIIDRFLEQKDGMIRFTHDVQFTGPFKKMIGNKVGKRYRKLLPSVMLKIKEIAESNK